MQHPYRKEQDIQLTKIVIPNNLKPHFTLAIKYQVDVLNLPQNHKDAFNKILDAFNASGDQDVEIELPSSFIKFILWRPIRDIFEKDLSIEEIALLKMFYKTVYHELPNAFVSCGK